MSDHGKTLERKLVGLSNGNLEQQELADAIRALQKENERLRVIANKNGILAAKLERRAKQAEARIDTALAEVDEEFQSYPRDALIHMIARMVKTLRGEKP